MIRSTQKGDIKERRGVLGLKRQRFCDEYFANGNGTQAVIKAGYTMKNAGQQAQMLLKVPIVCEYIAKLQGKQMKRFEVTADRVVQALAAIAFANIHDFWEALSKGKTPSSLCKNLTREQAAAVASVKMAVNGDVTFKLHDKLIALQLLGKRFGLFDDHINIHDDRGIFTVEQLDFSLEQKKALLKKMVALEAKQENGDDGQG